jgi:hypothetical protein
MTDETWSDYHGGEGSLDDYEQVATYNYPNIGGGLVHQKTRFALKWGVTPDEDKRSKTFRWEYLDEVIGTGHYDVIRGRGDVPVNLYRAPQLYKASPGGTRYVCEGEKDVHALLALDPDAVVTTAPSTKEWPAHCTRLFVGTDVVIIPDNDVVGERYVEMVGRAVAGVAKSVKVLRLFGPEDKVGADLSDWAEQQRLVGKFSNETDRRSRIRILDAFRKLVERAPVWRVTLDRQNPRPSAKVLVSLRFNDADTHRTIHRHKGGFYIYTGTFYREATDEDLKTVIWKFLDEHAQHLIPVKPPKEPKAVKEPTPPKETKPRKEPKEITKAA